MHTKNGSLIDLGQMSFVIWARMFREDSPSGIGTYDACMSLLAACVISVWLITRKVRAFEVVK